MIEQPTKLDIQRLFEADFEAGKLFWRVAPKGHPALLGREAGTPRRAHRLLRPSIPSRRLPHRRSRASRLHREEERTL
jgi:hypothetical protein